MEVQNPRTTDVNGEMIAYLEYNTLAQRAVLFVHGNLSSKDWWREAIAELGHDYRVFAVDMRGYGNSSYNQPISSIEDLATDIKLFCEKKELTNLTIVGWSLGGLVVMKLAELIPQRVQNVILTCSAGHLGICIEDPITNLPINSLERVKESEKHKFMLKNIEEKNVALMRGVFESALLQYAQHLSPERKSQLGGSAFQQRNYCESIVAIARPDIHLEKTTVKRWLVIVGKEDQITPFVGIEPTIKELWRLGRQVQVQTFEQAAHMVPVEHTNRYAKLIRQFVDGSG